MIGAAPAGAFLLKNTQFRFITGCGGNEATGVAGSIVMSPESSAFRTTHGTGAEATNLTDETRRASLMNWLNRLISAYHLAFALCAYAGVGFADCGASHNAKQALSPDQQANASQLPTVAKTTLPIAKAPVQVAKKTVNDKPLPDKVASNKPAE